MVLRLQDWAGSGGRATGRVLTHAEAAGEKALRGGTKLQVKDRALPCVLSCLFICGEEYS